MRRRFQGLGTIALEVTRHQIPGIGDRTTWVHSQRWDGARRKCRRRELVEARVMPENLAGKAAAT
jgi:hypothetical protein